MPNINPNIYEIKKLFEQTTQSEYSNENENLQTNEYDLLKKVLL